MMVRLKAAAEHDLREIGDYIAQDNPERAFTFVEELRERVQQIVLSPQGFRLRSEFGANIRTVAHGRYIIFFTVGGEEISIRRIVHGARNLKRLAL